LGELRGKIELFLSTHSTHNLLCQKSATFGPLYYLNRRRRWWTTKSLDLLLGNISWSQSRPILLVLCSIWFVRDLYRLYPAGQGGRRIQDLDLGNQVERWRRKIGGAAGAESAGRGCGGSVPLILGEGLGSGSVPSLDFFFKFFFGHEMHFGACSHARARGIGSWVEQNGSLCT